jgi:hypothetical protein
MARRLSTLLTASAAVLASTIPAFGSAHAAEGPGRLCADGNYFVIDYTAKYDGATDAQDGFYERAVPTTGGCASSWAQGAGQLSTAAIVGQCREGIEARFGPYPISIQFAEAYQLQNRADCIAVMSGVASGEIDPGSAPLFPGGTRPPTDH